MVARAKRLTLSPHEWPIRTTCIRSANESARPEAISFVAVICPSAKELHLPTLALDQPFNGDAQALDVAGII